MNLRHDTKINATMPKRFGAAAAVLACCVLAGLAGCATVTLAPSEQPLSNATLMQLGKMGMDVPAPIFIRIYKEESEFEIWKQRSDGRFYHFKTYPICNWSGELGPKVKHGDRQAPEGFYTIARHQMNPHSQFYLAFDMGFPNAYDRANKRTGDALMVHGKCKSAGCYAMTDALIEEIFALARESYAGGQEIIHVHAMPFRMTPANMARHQSSPWMPFWQTLKEGEDYFDLTHLVPDIVVCQRQYFVNAKLPGGLPVGKLDPEGACPALERGAISPFVPSPQPIGSQAQVQAQAQMQTPVTGMKMHGLGVRQSQAPSIR